MKIIMTLDQKAMGKSDRKFVYFLNGVKYSNLLTVKQAATALNVLKQLGVEVMNNTGLTF